MADVTYLHPTTDQPMPVDRVLDGARHCTDVLVLGWTADGTFYAASTTSNALPPTAEKRSGRSFLLPGFRLSTSRMDRATRNGAVWAALQRPCPSERSRGLVRETHPIGEVYLVYCNLCKRACGLRPEGIGVPPTGNCPSLGATCFPHQPTAQKPSGWSISHDPGDGGELCWLIERFKYALLSGEYQ